MSTIIISKHKYINVSTKLTKNEKPIVNMIEKKNQQNFYITLEDITPFIPIGNRHEDKNAERQKIKRLTKKGIVKAIGIGMYVLPKYEDQIKKNLTFPIIPKNKEEKKDLRRSKKKFYELIKPILQKNIWSDLLTHNINAKFIINGLYDTLYQIHTIQGNIKPHKRNKSYTIPFAHPSVSDRVFLFHFSPKGSITLQIGTTDNPINLKNDFYDTLITARNILMDFIKVWNFKVPALSDWTITLSHVHRDTLNKDYKKYLGGINGIADNYGLGILLYDHDKRPKRLRKFLRIESQLTKIDLNPIEAIIFCENNDPFKILNFCAQTDT